MCAKRASSSAVSRSQGQRRVIAISKPATGREEWEAMRDSIESGWLVQGPKVKAFEDAFARRHQVKYALATNNCTTALHLALECLGVGPGDEVIVPSFTWVATANAVVYTGARPVFVDVQEDTYNIDPALVAAALTPRTKAIMPVHLFGLCADMDEMRAVLPRHVRIVEDAACAAGASYKGRPAGTFGDIGCFSFHPRKSITTGEGGMLTTDDADIARRADVRRNHGSSLPTEAELSDPRPYFLPDVEVLGFNYRLTDPQAAMGLVQLAKLDPFIAERNRWARWYRRELADLDWLALPRVPENCGHAWQAFVTVVRDNAPLPRNEIMRRLQERGIATRPGTHAVTELAYYRTKLRLAPGQYAVATRLLAQSMALPLHNRMTADDYAYVVQSLREIAA